VTSADARASTQDRQDGGALPARVKFAIIGAGFAALGAVA
jgi:hypothetical protein